MHCNAILLLMLVASCFCINDPDIKSYLRKYGYMSYGYAFSHVTDVSTAIKRLQRFSGIPQTGVLDSKTLHFIRQPRCGNPDYSSYFYSFPMKWPKPNLTYKFVNFTLDLPQHQVKNAIKEAFKTWSDVSGLSITEAKDGVNADIKLQFSVRYHGDQFPFDGPGFMLAHAYDPPYGDTHFDDDEVFSLNGSNGVDLLWVATHEFGHALGLDHSNNKDSIMFPYYPGQPIRRTLHSTDIQRIQALYGANGDSGTTKTPIQDCKDIIIVSICEKWKKEGECVTNDRVRRNCAKTCGVCLVP